MSMEGFKEILAMAGPIISKKGDKTE